MNYGSHNYAQSELAYKEFLKPSLQQAVRLLNIRDNFRILDAGCGPGAMFTYFAGQLKPGGQVIGIDASDDHLEVAKKTIQQYQLQELVWVEKADLFGELPYEDDYFDIIWLSDVLFPDDFGDEIFNTLEKLYKKLKPNGTIALFYGNWLRLTLLPGYSILEHNISVANEKRKSAEFSWTNEMHPENALEWLNKCGFINCENHYASSYYQSPLKDNIKNYIHYHLTQIYGKAIHFKSPDFQIPRDQIDEFNKITDLHSAEYIINKPFYHCAAHAQLTTGQKRDYLQ